MNGKFITFEGIDGAGKSSHVDWLADFLRAQGKVVHVTREPGGTALGEKLRELLLNEPMHLETETLLMFAARREHLARLIEPALARGEWVVCDRFSDATFAYQGGGRGFDTQVLAQLERWVHADLQPQLTFWLDLPAAEAARRRAAARAADRFESEDIAFFDRVRAGYAARMAADPGRFVRIDSSLEREAVWAQIDAELVRRGW